MATDIENEVWVYMREFESDYVVSNFGRIASIKKEFRILKSQKHTAGYPKVTLWLRGKDFQKFVHTLVLENFVGTRPPGYQVCHNNGYKTDNRLENLRWGTPKENQSDRKAHGTASLVRSIRTLSREEVTYIRKRFSVLGNKSKVARELSLPRTTVADVINGRTWARK